MVNTIFAGLDSVTIELARRKIAQQMALGSGGVDSWNCHWREKTNLWLVISAVLGVAFIVGQWLAWRELKNRGFYVASNPSSSFVYVLTATHAIHLMGGIAGAGLRAHALPCWESRLSRARIVIEIAAWYWHFMAALWIYVFALLVFVP